MCELKNSYCLTLDLLSAFQFMIQKSDWLEHLGEYFERTENIVNFIFRFLKVD